MPVSLGTSLIEMTDLTTSGRGPVYESPLIADSGSPPSLPSGSSPSARTIGDGEDARVRVAAATSGEGDGVRVGVPVTEATPGTPGLGVGPVTARDGGGAPVVASGKPPVVGCGGSVVG
jgi:hypothetical protein